MPRTNAYSVNAITTYLTLAPHSSVDDISQNTGLSKATIYRVAKTHPAIKRDDRNSRVPRYSVDLDLAQQRIKAIEREVPKPTSLPVALSNKAQAQLDAILSMEIVEQVRVIGEVGANFAEAMAELVKAEHYAHALQHGQVEPSVVQWSNARERLTNLGVFAEMLQAYTKHYLDHPNSKTPEWWAIFPLESNQE